MTYTDHTSTAPKREVLSVTEINRRARQLLESHLSLVWIEGELSNVAIPSSGHWYFTLKDSQSQIRCAMFRNRNQSVRFRPEQGQKVLLRARASIYEGRGDYQLIVEHMQMAGQGDLQWAFDQLKLRLQQEGMFAEELKQSLPPMPQHIGVITSPTGAAIRDILTVFQRRHANIAISILPVAVQGQEAAPQIVRALQLAEQYGQFDAIILGRGGGSLEDLWPFNEEAVARAIANCSIPIVSAIGHETDITIADFVADTRAATPSAAAELLSPNSAELLRIVNGYQQLLTTSMRRLSQQHRQHLRHLRSRLRHPGEKLQHQSQALDHIEMRLNRAIKACLSRQQQQLKEQQWRLQHQNPNAQLSALTTRSQHAANDLQQAIKHYLQSKQQQFQQQLHTLDAVSPLNTLKRGYAVLHNSHQQVVQHTRQVTQGELITATVAYGQIDCQVLGNRPGAGLIAAPTKKRKHTTP